MKRFLSVVCCIVLLLAILLSLTACGPTIQDEWSTIILGEHLPTPEKGKLRSGSNLDDLFMGGIEKIDADYYQEYKKACIEIGYTIESDESGNNYSAYNANGYNLSLTFYSNQISISLKAPVELNKIEWPTTGIGSKLPVPISGLGKVTSDSSDCFMVTVGNTTTADYTAYVKECEEYGFIVDYTKADGIYEAKNAEGYRLNVRYVGFNQIEVMIQAPKQGNSAAPAVTTQPSDDEVGSNDTVNGMRPEFKEAMDSYEQFMDEYVAFVKKYSSNPTDVSLLADYTTYMSKYADFVSDFEKWEYEEMNTAETAYYINVQARVSKKLLEIAE